MIFILGPYLVDQSNAKTFQVVCFSCHRMLRQSFQHGFVHRSIPKSQKLRKGTYLTFFDSVVRRILIQFKFFSSYKIL